MNELQQNLLRSIPKVDELLSSPQLVCAMEKYPSKSVVETCRRVLDTLRHNIMEGDMTKPTAQMAIATILKNLELDAIPSLRPVINATGITLHTNLGRALIGKKAAQAAMDIACHYSTLEYNCAAGSRGSRHDHAQKLLTKLCGTEDAMVVNNNAAAVLLALGAIAKDKEVVVSRGELVEIGGSFRVPEIMQLGGNLLHEVGTTNKTRIADYANAINPSTGALLKVHTSNFKIMGFTEEATLDELAQLGAKHDIPVIYDLGGGALLDLSQFGIQGEPHITDILKSAIDILTFSGDKLLGGPQAGIIVGKKRYIDLMKKHPLARALRVDKVTLAMLCETLRCYLDEETAKKEIPTLSMLMLSQKELQQRASELVQLLEKDGIACSAVMEYGQVGGGSVPTQMIESYVCRIDDMRISAATLEKHLRENSIPIVGRISKDRVLLDMRTIQQEEIPLLSTAIVRIYTQKEKSYDE